MIWYVIVGLILLISILTFIIYCVKKHEEQEVLRELESYKQLMNSSYYSTPLSGIVSGISGSNSIAHAAQQQLAAQNQFNAQQQQWQQAAQTQGQAQYQGLYKGQLYNANPMGYVYMNGYTTIYPSKDNIKQQINLLEQNNEYIFFDYNKNNLLVFNSKEDFEKHIRNYNFLNKFQDKINE